MSYERDYAIMEGKRNSASDAYFGARHILVDTKLNRRIFDAAFKLGYEAAKDKDTPISTESLQPEESKNQGPDFMLGKAL